MNIRRALTTLALATGLGLTGAVAPAIVAAPGSAAGPAKAEAATYGWGGLCYTYRSAADANGWYYVVTYRWWTDSTGTYCSRYSKNWYQHKTWW